MKVRIPLQVIEGRLVLISVISSPTLRIPYHKIEFVIDTGSPHSYLSDKDVKKLQVPIKDRLTEGEVDFGGSRFRYVKLPKIDLYALKENKADNKAIKFEVSLAALKTTKTSEKKLQTAEALPSILGLDFLKEQKVSLYVILSENLAFLELEEC